MDEGLPLRPPIAKPSLPTTRCKPFPRGNHPRLALFRDEMDRQAATRTDDACLNAARSCHRILRGRTWGLHG